MAALSGPVVNEPHPAQNGHASRSEPNGASATAIADEARAAVERARAAQERWRLLPLRDRADALRLAAKDMLRRRAEIIALVHDEIGKAPAEGIFNEALGPLDTVSGWFKIVHKATARETVRLNPVSFPGKSAHVDLLPRGVVGVIAPWNYPVAGLYRATIPALLTGNAIVIKPSEYSPRSSAWFAERLAAALPEGLVQVLQGDGRTGAALVDAGIDALVFTGSPQTGRRVRVQCAERGIPSSIEMGGKDAAIVLADANLDRAARGVVWGAMMNAGQSCASIERVYVVRSVGEAFTRKVRDVVAALRPGVDVGPLVTAAQRARVSRQVEAAKAAGARVLTGGAGAAGDEAKRDYAPTVVRVDDDASALMREETFGPVLPIALVADENEAVERANASRYGLTASVWGRNRKKAQRVARRLRAGVVTINNHGFTAALPNAPWTGRGDSGWGITGSPLALHALTRPRFVLFDGSRRKRDLWWYPYTPALRNAALAMTTLRSGTRGLFARVGALFRLVGAILARARGM